MFHHVAYSEPMAKFAPLAMFVEQGNSLTINKGTQVNRPTKTGVESHLMEEEIMLTGQKEAGWPSRLETVISGGRSSTGHGGTDARNGARAG